MTRFHLAGFDFDTDIGDAGIRVSALFDGAVVAQVLWIFADPVAVIRRCGALGTAAVPATLAMLDGALTAVRRAHTCGHAAMHRHA